MTALIDQIFSKSQSDAIRKLWEDTSSRSLLQSEIGKQLLSHEAIIDQLPLTQIMLIVSMSNFAESDECNNVATIIHWGLHRVDILPLITEHKDKDLAYRCFISVSLFKDCLNRRYQRHGAPSVDFYRQIGIRTFNHIGMEDIGSHFNKWEMFLGEVFA